VSLGQLVDLYFYGAMGSQIHVDPVWGTVPHPRLRATPPGQRATGPYRSRTLGQRASGRANSKRRPLRRLALKMGHFAPFSQFLQIKCRNFPDVFHPFTSTYDPYEPWKVSWNRSALFEKSGRQTHKQTDAATLYTPCSKKRKTPNSWP